MKINHLGIIPDGNRRWAKANGVSLESVYQIFANKIVNIVKLLKKLDLNELSIYIASRENLTRKPEEIEPVVNAFVSVLPQIKQFAEENNVKVKFIGLYNVTQEKLLAIAMDIQNATQNNTDKVINMLVGYNPYDEIEKSIRPGDTQITVEDLEVNTYVDLVIRTGGKPVRLSNFLPLQCGYANVEVFDKYFIDLSEENIIETIKSYESISPRYGK